MSGKNFATKYDGSLGISFGDIIKRETYREMERELTAKLSISSSKVIVASGVSHTPTIHFKELTILNALRMPLVEDSPSTFRATLLRSLTELRTSPTSRKWSYSPQTHRFMFFIHPEDERWLFAQPRTGMTSTACAAEFAKSLVRTAL
jgi:hypothetical protein